MSEIYVPCPACETRIRFREGLPDRDAIDCPQCGEVIPLRRSSRPRREETPRRRYEDPPRRSERRAPVPPSREPRGYRAGRSAQNPEEGHSAGFWVGIIGGCIGLTCLILGLIFFFHSKDDTPVAQPETVAETTPDTSATADASANAGQQLVANLLPTTNTNNTNPTPTTNKPAPSVVPNWNMPTVNAGDPTPTLPAGPDGVIPAPQVAGGGKPIDDADRLKYRWNAHQTFAYRTTIKVELGGETKNLTGVTRYQVLGHDPTMVPPEEEEEGGGSATGTGFVVHPDGYLMTCAHVIEDATRVEVELGKHKYLARVVALNSKRDLALLRIAARNLPVLPLGNTSQVELAEHVRAVGYPLADVLGNSVKITQGSVAGFIDGKSGRMIQVDASINPGNSGGPLVNDRGDAIGVVSSGYFGSEIAEVGLAIPTDDVAALMRKHGVSPTAGGLGRHLDGPELAKKVTPSVAFLKVTLGPASKEGLVLRHSTTCTTTTTRNGRPVAGKPSSTKTETGKILVDEFGQILHADGADQPLPFLMGPFGQVAIEPISPNGEDSWGTMKMTAIPQIQRNESVFDPYSRAGIPRPPYSRRPRGIPRGPRGPRGIPRSPFAPSVPQETVKFHLALEVCEYEFADSTPAVQVISKTYEFQTVDDVENPYFRLSGKGTIRFDRARNMPQQVHSLLNLQIRTDDGLVQAPIEVLCERVPDNEVGQFPQGVPVPNVPRTTPQPPNRNPPAPQVARPERADTLEEHLAILGDPNANFNQKYPSLSAIKNTTPDDKNRKAVLDAVEPYLKDSNLALQTTAIDAFGEWGTEDRATVLFEMAVGYSQTHRRAAIKALGKIGGKKSAETVVKRLTEDGDMLVAARALKEMGRVAEEPVLKLIDHETDQVRLRVYQILGEVGGPKSEAALKVKSQSDPSSYNRAAAQIALRDLQTRQ